MKELSFTHVLLGLLVGKAAGVTGDNVVAGDNVGGIDVGPPIKEQVHNNLLQCQLHCIIFDVN